MDNNTDNAELLQYLNTVDFAKKHKSEPEEKTRSFLEMMQDDIQRHLEEKWEDVKLEWGIWDISEKEKAEVKRREAIMAHDATRPSIKDLPFQPIPAEKADGLKGGFLAMAWNKFVEEVAAGRAEIAEVVILDYMDTKFDEDNPDYYFKVADPDGNVYGGGVRKIKYKTLGMVDARYTSPKHDDYVAYFRWEWPEDYVKGHPNRSEEEYKLYEMVFMANGLADKVLTDKRKHAYVLHFKKRNKDVYGLITESEYEDLKCLKDDITMNDPEYCFKAYNNTTLSFTWQEYIN